MRPLTAPTLEDVARAAGVSISTASRALSGKAPQYRISASTVARVESSARELGFKPNIVARSLRFQRTGLIGVVVPDITNIFFAEVARRVTLAAEDAKLSVIIADSREKTENEVRLIGQLYDRQVEGLVVCPVGLECTHLLSIHRSGLPLVLVDRVFPDTGITSVTSEQHDSAYRLAQSLIRRGHRRMGILSGLQSSYPGKQRLIGVRKALDDAGLAWDEQTEIGCEFSVQSGFESALKLIGDRSLTAIIALSNQIGMGALQAILRSNRILGKDLEIVCFDRHPMLEFVPYQVVTAEQQITRIAEVAAQLLLEKIDLENKAATENHAVVGALPSAPKPYFHEIETRMNSNSLSTISVC